MLLVKHISNIAFIIIDITKAIPNITKHSKMYRIVANRIVSPTRILQYISTFFSIQHLVMVDYNYKC